MIKESLYFSFAGRRSSDFGILNVSVQSGLFEEAFMSSRSIRETSVRGNPKPYFSEVERQSKTLPVNFAFEDTWNDDLINEVARWLDVDYYEPLFFSENLDKVFYAMPVDDISIIHNGLKQGYLTLNFRCDSPYNYSHEIATDWEDCTSGDKIIEFENLGTNDIKPIIEIIKVETGDLAINNLSDYGEEFKFTGLTDGEELIVDCEHQEISVNLTNTWRYDNFNDKYLSIPYGVNNLQITGKCYMRFIYRHVFSN